VAKIAEGKTGGRDDDRYRQLEENGRRQEEQHRRDMEARDAREREERIRAEFKEQQLRTETMMRELKESAQRGPDPMLEYLKENQRTQLEVSRQINEANRASLERVAAFTVSPVQLAEMMTRQASGSDQFMRNILTSVTGVVDLYRSATEQIAGLSGGGAGSWVPDMISGITGRAGQAAEKYFDWQRDKEVSENKAKIAEAQARAHEASLRAQATAGMRQGFAGAMPGGNGARPAAQPVTPQGPAGPAPAAPTPEAQPGAQPVAQVIPMKRPMTEEEMFGPAYRQVLRLREYATAYVTLNGGLVPDDQRKSAKNEAGEDVTGVSPDQAVEAVISGAEEIEKFANAGQIQIPPAFQLYAQENWASFVDLLVPKLPLWYKEEMVRIFSEETEPDGEGAESAKPAAPEKPADPDLQV
jgi:hypothetical protein